MKREIKIKTIEERADEAYPIEFVGVEDYRKCYIKGATDQREIDIDKACEWLKRELADPMPDELYQQWCDEKLKEFRKELEQ